MNFSLDLKVIFVLEGDAFAGDVLGGGRRGQTYCFEGIEPI